MSLGSLGASVGSEGASQKWHFSWEAKEGAQWLWTYKKKKSVVLNLNPWTLQKKQNKHTMTSEGKKTNQLGNLRSKQQYDN